MRNLLTQEFEHVSGGTCGPGFPDPCDPPPPTVKGNNGWGNGPDSTNPGSFSGGTVTTKEDNTRGPGDTSPGHGKFTTR